MNSNVKLGRISGIEIGLHYSWFIIAALIVFSLGEHFRQVNPNRGVGEISIPALFTGVLVWLGYINIALAFFNMIPGFPLDGGRVLRSLVWAITKNADRSICIAARVGQVVAFLFILDGIWRYFSGAGFGGLWIAFIGWFLMDAAKASYAEVGTTAALRGMRVYDVMSRDCVIVNRGMSLRDFVDIYLLKTGQRC